MKYMELKGSEKLKGDAEPLAQSLSALIERQIAELSKGAEEEMLFESVNFSTSFPASRDGGACTQQTLRKV